MRRGRRAFFGNPTCGRERVFVFLVTPLLFAALGAFIFVVLLQSSAERIEKPEAAPVARHQLPPLEPARLKARLEEIDKWETTSDGSPSSCRMIATAYSEVTASNPESARAWAGAGRALIALGECAQAAAALDRACELDILNAGYLNARAIARRGIRDLRGAFADCVSALRIQPKDAVVSNRMLLLALELGDDKLFEAKLASLSGSLDGSPDPRSVVARAVREVRAGETESATTLLQSAAELLSPGDFAELLADPLFSDSRGTLLLARFREAQIPTAAAQ